jgi:lactoylglutathione lyase
MSDPNAGQFRLLHTMIRVRDLEASLRFYTVALRMKLLRKRDYDDFTLAFVGYGNEADHTVIELKYDWNRTEPDCHGTKFGHLAVSVQEIHLLCARLAAIGVKILRPPAPTRPGGAVLAFIEDPDGYQIELIELS